eukprot:9468686-Pyramimonas_sp.AAC.1
MERLGWKTRIVGPRSLFGAPLGAVLGSSMGRLGRLLGHLGALFGAFGTRAPNAKQIALSWKGILHFLPPVPIPSRRAAFFPPMSPPLFAILFVFIVTDICSGHC